MLVMIPFPIDAGLIASTIYGGAGKDSVWIVDGASTASLIDGGVGNDFLSLGGLSGTSSLLGGAGEDSITVAGATTQWLVDGGDDNDSIYVTNVLSEVLFLVEVVLTASNQRCFQGLCPRLVLVMTPSMSLRLVLPVHHLKGGVGDDLMSITGGITDGSLFGGTGNDSFNFLGGQVHRCC